MKDLDLGPFILCLDEYLIKFNDFNHVRITVTRISLFKHDSLKYVKYSQCYRFTKNGMRDVHRR